MKSTYSKILVTAGIVFVFLTVSQTAAAKVEIKLSNPEKFKDIEVTNQARKRSIDSLSKDMTRLFERLVKKHLSDDKNLLVELTEVDLAGRVEHMVGPNHEDLRIIRDNDSYRLSFNYKLMDKEGNAIRQGEAKLKSFLSRSPDMRRKLNRTTTDHFERELDRWFKTEFK